MEKVDFYSSISLPGSGFRIRIRIQPGNFNLDPKHWYLPVKFGKYFFLSHFNTVLDPHNFLDSVFGSVSVTLDRYGRYKACDSYSTGTGTGAYIAETFFAEFQWVLCRSIFLYPGDR